MTKEKRPATRQALPALSAGCGELGLGRGAAGGSGPWGYKKKLLLQRVLHCRTPVQPLANPAALPLPYTITLRLSKESILLLIGLVLVFAVLMAGVFAWLNDGFLFISPDRFHSFLVLFAITASFMVIALLALFLSPFGRQKVDQ